MVKSYYKYNQLKSFGVIVSPTSNAVFDYSGKFALAGCHSHIVCWNIKKGEPEFSWLDADANNAQVSIIARAPHSKTDFAAGYEDGSIRIWSIGSQEPLVVFNGHKSTITCLSFSNDGTRLASGSKDTDVVIWDIVQQQGLFRMRGHKAVVTSVHFLDAALASGTAMDHLITTSKDSILKVWDLATQNCVDTIIASRGELYSCGLSPDQQYVVTGGSDPEMKLWKLDLESIYNKLRTAKDSETLSIVLLGSIVRHSADRLVRVSFDARQSHVVAQASDRTVEVYKVRSVDEIKKKLTRRERKAKDSQGASPAAGNEKRAAEITADDVLALLYILRTRSKARSFDFSPSSAKKQSKHGFQLLISTQANTLELYGCGSKEESDSSSLLSEVCLPGHRSGIRSVCLSSDNQMIATGSSSSVKVWNLKEGSSIRTLDSGFCLSMCFVCDDRILLAGTKTGAIQIFDLSRSALVGEVKAHDGALYSLALSPNKRFLLTGGADKDVKEWEIVDEDGSLELKRTLRMTDHVLCVRYSPDDKLIAVSLLDCTVKLFYYDSFKFYLSLYGHKLPVLSMDIASDSTLIATGSADKSVKLWGLDFGDCHRSLLAHSDSVTAVQFVFGTHYLFTASKDGIVKYWDADTWECVQRLEGQVSEIWGLSVGKFGEYVVTGGESRALVVWNRSDEHLFIEEEKEREMEKMYDASAVQAANRVEGGIGSGVDGADAEDKPESGKASMYTLQSLKSSEKILEALQVFKEERKYLEIYRAQLAAWKAAGSSGPMPVIFQRNPFIVATGKLDMTAEEYLLSVVERIKSSEFDESVLLLGFNNVLLLLEAVYIWVCKGWNLNLCYRVVYILLSTHQNEVCAYTKLRSLLRQLKTSLQFNLYHFKDNVGFNKVALECLYTEWKEKHTNNFEAGIESESKLSKMSKKTEKRKRVLAIK